MCYPCTGCGACGIKPKPPMQNCIKCGAQLDLSNARCPECGWMLPLPPGAKLPTADESNADTQVTVQQAEAVATP